MTTYYNWQLDTDADWFATGGWSPAGPPDGFTATAVVTQAGTYTITLAATEAAAIGGFSLNSAEATLQVAGLLYVAGTSNNFDVADGAVSVAAGGSLISGGQYQNIGDAATANASMTVSGIGATWVAAAAGGAVTVGNAGNGTLTVANGASLIDAGDLDIGWGYGAPGAHGIMTISGGGYVSNAGTYTRIGATVGSSGTVAVTGSNSNTVDSDGTHVIGSTWSVASVLLVGFQGRGILNISNGGTVDVLGLLGDPSIDPDTTIGKHTGAAGSKVSVSGNRSLFQVNERLVVGRATTGTLDVSAGGLVRLSAGVSGNEALFIGFSDQGITGNGLVTVRGGTIQATGGSVQLGVSGGTGQLAISVAGTVSVQGGDLQDGAFNVGNSDSAHGLGHGTVTVTGAKSLLDVVGRSFVGQNDSVGRLTVSAGATFDSTSTFTNGFGAIIGVNANAPGSPTYQSVGIVVITGKGSTWTQTDVVASCVGLQGKGTLDVLAGGTVTFNNGLYAGFEAGGAGTALVSGAGSTLGVGGGLYLGASYNGAGPGGTGTLTVTKGGAASFAGAHNYIFAGSTITVDNTSFVEFGGTVGAQAGKLVIDAGATLTGGGRIAANVLDRCLIDTTGSLVVTHTLTGTGIARLEAGATLEVGTVAGGTIDFAGAATLKLDTPTHFHGQLSDIVAGDTLVLKNLAVSSASFVARTLHLILAAGGTENLTLTHAVAGLAASVITAAGSSTLTIGAALNPAETLGGHSGTYLSQNLTLDPLAHVTG